MSSVSGSVMFWVVVALLLAACKPVQSALPDAGGPAASAPASSLLFEPDHVDIGTVREGEEAVAYLRLRNAGSAIATITAVETSCGCSVAEPEQRLLMPGAFTRIRVVIDTFAKQGEAKKWVQVTDDAGRRSRAWLTLHVQRNPHLKVGSRSIFQGKCAACHYDPARGKRNGAAIYRAVCAMCHGAQREGASGPSLQHHRDADVLAAVIANGVGSQHMPGFARAHGGPLTRAQISALAQWLSTLDE